MDLKSCQTTRSNNRRINCHQVRTRKLRPVAVFQRRLLLPHDDADLGIAALQPSFNMRLRLIVTLLDTSPRATINDATQHDCNVFPQALRRLCFLAHKPQGGLARLVEGRAPTHTRRPRSSFDRSRSLQSLTLSLQSFLRSLSA